MAGLDFRRSKNGCRRARRRWRGRECRVLRRVCQECRVDFFDYPTSVGAVAERVASEMSGMSGLFRE